MNYLLPVVIVRPLTVERNLRDDFTGPRINRKHIDNVIHVGVNEGVDELVERGRV